MGDANAGLACVATNNYSIFGVLDVPPIYWQAALNNPDAISAAYSLGRLDVVSLLLTYAGLFFGILGLLGYGVIRLQARIVAKNEAQSEIQIIAPSEISKFLRDNPTAFIDAILSNELVIQRIFRESVSKMDLSEYIFANGDDPDAANRIARAMEGGAT